MFSRLGAPELLIILAIALLIFGPSALPKLGKSIGSAIGSFKAGHAEAVKEAEEKNTAAEEKQA